MVPSWDDGRCRTLLGFACGKHRRYPRAYSRFRQRLAETAPLRTLSLPKNGNIRSHFVDLRLEAMPATGNARSSASAFVRRRLSGLSDSILGKAAASIPAMQPASLLADWERAESQVVSAKKRVSDQIEAIAWLSWFGDDAVEAKALLRKFEMALAKHLSDREQLRMQLALSQGTEARAYPRHAQTR